MGEAQAVTEINIITHITSAFRSLLLHTAHHNNITTGHSRIIKISWRQEKIIILNQRGQTRLVYSWCNLTQPRTHGTSVTLVYQKLIFQSDNRARLKKELDKKCIIFMYLKSEIKRQTSWEF